MKETLPPANSQEGLEAECSQSDSEREIFHLTRSQRDELADCFHCGGENQCLKCGNGMVMYGEDDQPSLCETMGLTPGEITMEDYHILRRALRGEFVVIMTREK